MNLEEMIRGLASGETPTVGMGVGALVVLLIAAKAGKGIIKFILVLAAFALIGGAVWWHFHQKH